MKWRTAVLIGDTHSGFTDNKAVDAAIRTISYLKPDVVIHLGDLMDCYSLSQFSKDIYRLESLQSEIDSAKTILRRMTKAAPKARRYLLAGNHEDRLEKVVFSASGELKELLKSDFLKQNLNWPTLLSLSTFGFEWIPSNKQSYGSILPHLLIKHGTIVRKYSGYSARAEFEQSGVSGASGHTHRLAMYEHTNVHGRQFWIETGCLCETKNVCYISGVPNWQNGLAVLTLVGKEVLPELVHIVNGTAYLRGTTV